MTEDKIEAWLKEYGQQINCPSCGFIDTDEEKLLALVRVYRDQNDAILDQCRRKGYPTGTEWIVLADTARAAEEKAKEIVGR